MEESIPVVVVVVVADAVVLFDNAMVLVLVELTAAVVDDAVAHDEQGKSNGDVCVVIAASASLGVVARAEGPLSWH